MKKEEMLIQGSILLGVIGIFMNIMSNTTDGRTWAILTLSSLNLFCAGIMLGLATKKQEDKG